MANAFPRSATMASRALPCCSRWSLAAQLNVRHFAERRNVSLEDQRCVFNTVQMAGCVHVQMPECAFRKEAAMFAEMKATRIRCFRGPESSSTSEYFHSRPFVGLRNALPTDVKIVSPFVDQLTRFISRFRVADRSKFEIELALREALVNAIVHGNGGIMASAFTSIAVARRMAKSQ